MKTIHILAKVISRHPTGYRVEVNKDISKLPIGEVSTKLIECTLELELGKVYYFPESRLEEGKVYVASATLLGEVYDGTTLSIPEETQSKILDKSITPSEL